MGIIFPLLDRIESLNTKEEDNVIKSKFENGAVQVRQKYTRSRKTFKLKYAPLTVLEFNGLLAFYKENGLATIIIFQNPSDNISYSCRITKPLEYTINGAAVNVIDTSIELEEV